MNYVKMIFSVINSHECDEEQIIDIIWTYLGCLCKNGQILKEYELVKCGDALCAFITVPEQCSLDKKFNNKYINEYYEKLIKVFNISTDIIGENLNCTQPCVCQNPSWYMLYTDYSVVTSPIVCGDCGREVPLYRLPYIIYEEYFNVISWQNTYQCIDKIWLSCLSDRFTYRQMSDPKSQLSINGREICAEFEKKLGKPFYYYLFHYNKTKKVCPVCGKEWKLENSDTFIDYKCDECRLVADEI